MTRWAPLPLAPPPYPNEALHAWVRRLAAMYALKPPQLLHALGVTPFAGPIYTYPSGALRSALKVPDLRYLAGLARCDPSRLVAGERPMDRCLSAVPSDPVSQR